MKKKLKNSKEQPALIPFSGYTANTTKNSFSLLLQLIKSAIRCCSELFHINRVSCNSYHVSSVFAQATVQTPKRKYEKQYFFGCFLSAASSQLKSPWSNRQCVGLLDEKPWIESQARHQNGIRTVFLWRFPLSRFLAKTL